MASKTTTNMAAIVGLGRVASQVTLLEPEPALYSAAWSRDQSSDQTVTCAYTMRVVSRAGGKTWSKCKEFMALHFVFLVRRHKEVF